MKVTLRKVNADRKLIDKEIDRLVNDISAGAKPIIGFHVVSNDFMGIISVDQYKVNCVANWQSLNDLIVRRNYLNEKTMLAYGGLVEVPSVENSYVVTVPKFIGFDKSTNDTETLTIAQAISRKNWFSSEIKTVINMLERRVTEVEIEFNKTQKRLESDLTNMLNSQFGPESSHTSKQRIEFMESIKSKYTLEVIDPLNIKSKIDNARKVLSTYLSDIDSIISRATETTEIEINGQNLS